MARSGPSGPMGWIPIRSRTRLEAGPGLDTQQAIPRSEERRVGKERRSLWDWSADVCSADLDGKIRAEWTYGVDPNPLQDALGGRTRSRYPAGDPEIGRASCREREEISVGLECGRVLCRSGWQDPGRVDLWGGSQSAPGRAWRQDQVSIPSRRS